MKHMIGKVDVSTWNLEVSEKLSEFLESWMTNEVSEVITLAFADDDTYADFPAKWDTSDGEGGPPVDNPLSIYFRVALDNGDDAAPIWKTSLQEILDSTIEACREDGAFSDGLERIRDALQGLTDRISEALASNASREVA